MESIDFSQPSRQSSKGILVIFMLNTIKFIRRYFVVFLAFGLSLSKGDSWFNLSIINAMLIILGIFLLILIVSILKYLNFKFYLDKDRFYLSAGIFNKDITVVPKSNIQNIYIQQNFIQQLINVVSLKIQTAGDDKTEIEINALSHATALDLKNQLFVKNQVSNSPIEKEPAQSTVFFKASIKRLLLEGISQNHFRSLLIIISFVFGLYNEFENYLEDFGVSEQLKSSVHVDTGNIINILIANMFIVVFAILGSMLFSVINTFISNFNLKVIENKEVIEINKGLFNKLSLILDPMKVQNIIIKTNRLKDYYGLNTLSIKQTMINIKHQKNFEIVALEKPQIAHLIQKIFTQYNDEGAYHKPDIYYKRVLWVRSISLAIFVNIAAFFIFETYFWLINIILIPWIVLFVHFTYKKTNYQITEHYLTINNGFIDRVRNISELHNIQSVEFKQNIFQKRKNIASLSIATASDKVKIPYIPENNAKSIIDYLLFKMES